MSRAIKVGSRYEVMPIPLVPENTAYVNAGVLDIGVEYRILTDEVLEAAIPVGVREAGGIEDSRPDGGLDEHGVSLHVCDAADHVEYLRFDAFGGDPHYHYIVPGSHNIVVGFDEAAHGDFLAWTMERLASRLPEMLQETGADELAAGFDQQSLDAALPAVRERIKESLRSQAV